MFSPISSLIRDLQVVSGRGNRRTRRKTVPNPKSLALARGRYKDTVFGKVTYDFVVTYRKELMQAYMRSRLSNSLKLYCIVLYVLLTVLLWYEIIADKKTIAFKSIQTEDIQTEKQKNKIVYK